MSCNFEEAESLIVIDNRDKICIIPFQDRYNVQWQDFKELTFYRTKDKVAHAEQLEHRVVKSLEDVRPYLTRHGYYRKNVNTYSVWLFNVNTRTWYYSYAGNDQFVEMETEKVVLK